MIQIICGVYGGKDGAKRPGDKPFSLSPAEEARLVARKVAVYVNEPTTEPDDEGEYIPDDAPIGFGETPPEDFDMDDLPDGVIGIPEYSVAMKASELREIGKLCGLTFKVGMTKEEMVAALDKHIEENMVDDEDFTEDPTIDPEDAPTFDAAEAVEE